MFIEFAVLICFSPVPPTGVILALPPFTYAEDGVAHPGPSRKAEKKVTPLSP